MIGLERAGHVAAVITILADEAHLVARMQDALSGQLNRRQEMLRAAGNFASIADYAHARSHGRALPPLPALFIVVVWLRSADIADRSALLEADIEGADPLAPGYNGQPTTNPLLAESRCTASF